METIIGLLFILLPVIFKLIGKKLEQSGQTGTARKMHEMADVFSDEEAPDDDGYEPAPEPEPAAVPAKPAPIPVSAPVPAQVSVSVSEPVRRPKPSVRPVVAKKPILVEEEAVKREKIDPKKLVIYSEIMKPKF